MGTSRHRQSNKLIVDELCLWLYYGVVEYIVTEIVVGWWLATVVDWRM